MEESNPVSELSHRMFEDPEDCLEYIYEKLEEATYLWTIWSRVFLEGAAEEVKSQVFVDMVKEELRYFQDKTKVEVFCDDGIPSVVGTIRRFSVGSKSEESRAQSEDP
jgi:hypothetical protein